VWALFLPAMAGLQATLTAEVSADGTVQGQLILPADVAVMDALAALPGAPDDLNQLRTFPGAPDSGELSYERTAPGEYRFHTRLPKRFGAVGHTAHGTYASGFFYPQPLVDGQVPEIEWTVQITLPEGAVGVVGSTVGEGTLEWTGRSDRVVLALPRRAQVQTLQVHDLKVTVVGKRRPRRALLRAVRNTLSQADLPSGEVVLVEAPLRRRLVRPSNGVALVSDRIFRLFPLFERYHRHGFVQGVLTAASPLPDGLLRELDGSTRAERWKLNRPGGGATGLTRSFSWLPQIDYLISSRRIAFYSELFEEVHPGDAVQDDLIEVLSPHRPGSSVRVQLDDRYGPGSSDRVLASLLDGRALSEALSTAGFDPNLPAAWSQPVPQQDYVLTVDEGARLTRLAPEDSPPETVVVRTESGPLSYTLRPGESASLPPSSRYRVDPSRHILQTSRARDSWPQQPLRVVATSFIGNINLTRFRLAGTGALYVRGRYDTHNLFSGILYSARSTLVGSSLGWTRKFGPLKDGISRQHRLRFSAGPRVIDPAFLSTEDGPVSVAGSVSYSWDTRVSSDFPLQGHRLSARVTGGFYPGSSTRWSSARISATGLTSPHPRHAFAARASAAIARASRTDQLLTLGGLGSMRSLPVLAPCHDHEDPCAQVARESLYGTVEYRVAPLRGMSVPLGIAWWTELQLIAGLEGTAATLLAGDGAALGATLGIAGVGDLAGAEPTFLGFSAGWLLWADGITYAQPLQPVPEIYLLWSHAL